MVPQHWQPRDEGTEQYVLAEDTQTFQCAQKTTADLLSLCTSQGSVLHSGVWMDQGLEVRNKNELLRITS